MKITENMEKFFDYIRKEYLHVKKERFPTNLFFSNFKEKLNHRYYVLIMDKDCNILYLKNLNLSEIKDSLFLWESINCKDKCRFIYDLYEDRQRHLCLGLEE